MTVAWADLSPDEQMAAARIGGPAEWSKLMNPEWPVPDFVRRISDIIRDEIAESIRERDGGLLMISLPPGHNKSYIASVNTPEWFLEKYPDKRVAIVSYGHRRAMEWGEEIRNHIRENPDKFAIRLRKDTTAKDRFHTEQGGGVLCTGIGGPLTGFRAHLVGIDDPVKDDEEAKSEVMREKHWNWFRTVAITRRWPEAMTFIVMTRWHEDDLVGRVHALYAEAEKQGTAAKLPRLRVIRIPCIAEEDDVLGRTPGEPLWPEMGYDERWAERTRYLVGSHVWATMYQQRPSPEGGGIFKLQYFRYFTDEGTHYALHAPDGKAHRVLKSECRYFQTADTAMTEKDTSDFTVVSTFALTPLNHLLVVNVERARLEIPEQWPFVQNAIARARTLGSYLWTAVEDKGSGTGLLQLGRKLGMPLRALKAERDKTTRATPASVWYENGMVYHARNAHWLADFEHELLAFPNGSHDDQVDTVAYAVLEARARPSEPIVAGTTREPALAGASRGIFDDFTTRDRSAARSMWRQ